MEVYVSSINFVTRQQRKLSEIVPIMLNAGIDNIEISSIHPYEPGLERRLMDWGSEARLLIHNFAPPSHDNLLLNLSSRFPALRKKTSEFIKDKILLCKRLGIAYYSFHAGFCVEYEFGKTKYTTVMPRKDALDVFIAEVQKLADFAMSEGVHIGVENHVSRPDTQELLILDDITDFNFLFSQMDSDYLHVHLDLGHLNVSAGTRGFAREDFIQRFSDKILAVHAHDNNGLSDQHLPLAPHSWILKELPGLSRLEYVILETESNGNIEIVRQMVKMVSSA